MESSPNIKITAAKLLLVEGKDDQVVCQTLLRELGIDGVQVDQCGGKTPLAERLRVLSALPNASKLTHVAAVRDADIEPEAARQSMRDIFSGPIAKLGLPSQRAQYFICPDDIAKGAVEDLFIRAIAADPAGQCVQAFFRCLADQSLSCADSSHLKAAIFLTTRIGLRTKATLEDVIEREPALLRHEAFNPLRNFLHTVFAA